MLEPSSAKLAEADVTNVELVQGGFLTCQHVGAAADVVYSRFALQHLSDFWNELALERARRILRPGGLLRLWDVVYNFSPPRRWAR